MFKIGINSYRIANRAKYCITENNLTEIQEKLIKDKALGVIITDADFVMAGVLTKGDVLGGRGMNHEPFYLEMGFEPTTGQLESMEKFSFIPVLEDGKVIKILEKFPGDAVRVGKFEMSPSSPLVIAEIGNNHNGNLERAFNLVESASSSGVDAIKFQARKLEETYVSLDEDFLDETDYGTAYTVRQLKNFNLSFSDLQLLFQKVRSKGLSLICTAFDIESAKFIVDENVDAIKIASADMLNFDLYNIFKYSNIPLIISTGMHTLDEINELNDFSRKNFLETVLLHVNSTYPTPYEDVELKFMPKLSEYSTSKLFGYSGHERGYHIPLVALGLGASVIEKHFTDDPMDVGNDHKVSLIESEFTLLVKHTKEVIVSLGKGFKRVSQGERLNQIPLAKGLYFKGDMEKGTIVNIEHLNSFSPCVGVPLKEKDKIIGKSLAKGVRKNEPVKFSDFTVSNYETDANKLLNFGLPVRFRDIEVIRDLFKPRFVEYHMFASDLNVDPKKFAEVFDGSDIAVHAPEQFDDGFVLDLVSESETIREESKERFDTILNWVLSVKELNNSDTVKLITNVGGATMNPDERYTFDKVAAYKNLSITIKKARELGIEVLPQSMPPFPWHFGGQGYHRLFVDLKDMEEMQDYCEVKFCMDVSHTWMSMSELGLDFYKEIFKYRSLYDYYHIADAKYPTDEGVQLGKGEIDFRKIRELFIDSKSFYIPEVWNGHLDDFKGFKYALNLIEKL